MDDLLVFAVKIAVGVMLDEHDAFDTKTCVLLANVAGLSPSLWKESWQLQFLTMVSRFDMLP